MSSIDQPVDGRKVCHLERGTAARMALVAKVDRGSISNAGGWAGRGAMEQNYLTRLPFKQIRTAAGFGIEPGHAHWLRAVLPVPEALAAAVYPEVWELGRSIDTDAFPSSEVCTATRQFIVLMKYLATVMVQDFAYMYDDLKGNEILSFPPFNDNTFGFHDFRVAQSEAIAAANVEKLAATDAALLKRGDTETAGVIREVITFLKVSAATTAAAAAQTASAAAQVAATSTRDVYKLVTNIHERVVTHGSGVLGGGGAASGTSAGAVAGRVEPPGLVPDVSDPGTWNENVPVFASTFRFDETIDNVQGVANEYLAGSAGRASVKSMETKWGPDAMTKGVFSWRSKNQPSRGNNRAVDTAFCKRNHLYRALDQGATVEALQKRIDEHFPGVAPDPSHVNWLLSVLKSEAPGAQERSAAAVSRHIAKRQKTAASGAITTPGKP